MDRLSTAIRYVPGVLRNERLVDLTDQFRNKDNAAFLAEVAAQLKGLQNSPEGPWFSPGGSACIGLSGAYGLIGSLIRQAQALIRVDRAPSYWSHSFLFYSDLSTEPSTNRDSRRSAWIWESTLEPATPFNHFIERNGVGARRIADYTYGRFDLFREHCVPNMSVIAIGLTPEERQRILDRADDPNVDQLAYDLGALLGTWYAYLTDRAQKPNPLASGNAVYCSAYLQLAYDAVGIDIAPGAHERNTSPEHIWQLARYLSSALQVVDPRTGGSTPRPIRGWYCVRDKAAGILPLEEERPRRERAKPAVEERPQDLPLSLREATALLSEEG